MGKKIEELNIHNNKINKSTKAMSKKSVKKTLSKKGETDTSALTTKNQPAQPIPTPKRRGRRPKKILENIDNIDGIGGVIDSIKKTNNMTNQTKNDSAVILRLNIDPSKLIIPKKITANTNKSNTNKSSANKSGTSKSGSTKSTTISKAVTNANANANANTNANATTECLNSSDESSETMFVNDIPKDNTCQKCIKNELTIASLSSKLEKYEQKDKSDKTSKIHCNKLNFISVVNGKKIVLKKTDIWCWWDSHPFGGLPFPLPESYHDGTYYILGCFCSINCALAYNLYFLKDSKIYQRKSLAYQLYREMYGISSTEELDIREAMPQKSLDVYGGDMTIKAFRRSLIAINKEYIEFVPPMRPINFMIEERTIETSDATDPDKKYAIKRSKPLIKKNRSIITSMRK